MRPLAWIATGFVLVAFDMRVDAYDMAPDLIGWLCIAWGARHVTRPAVPGLALAAAAASAVDFALPSRMAPVDPRNGHVLMDQVDNSQGFPEVFVFEHIEGVRLALLWAAFAAAALTTWLLIGDLRRRADAFGRTAAARELGLLQGLVPGLWTGPYVIASSAALFAGGSFDPVWNGTMEYVALVGLAPVVWLVTLTLRERDYMWAVSPTPDPTGPAHATS
jgi:hypothetical protein